MIKNISITQTTTLLDQRCLADILEADYLYSYQGQEKDYESDERSFTEQPLKIEVPARQTGFEAFELRQWDGRIGRLTTTDPYGQYASPYLGMGNSFEFLGEWDESNAHLWNERMSSIHDNIHQND